MPYDFLFPNAALLIFFVAGVAVYAGTLRRQRKTAIERVLYAEVISLRCQAAGLAVEISRRHMAGESFDARFFALWPLSEPLIYPGAGPAALGRLSREALDRIGYFHAQLADARARLATARMAGHFEPTPYRMLSGLVRSYNHVDPWIRDLRPRLGGFLWDEPDMSKANTLLGEFEDDDSEPLVIAYCWVDCAYP